ncbi:MAG: hypothetical protein H8K06_20180 [Nitrospira sp.]|uniref:hypothetical protein n=1 Tax=Nitrospira defluvii TaxID=330214 RepID=UPI001BB478E2|nr:hypothetical protein [Nitrospira defluvii]MCS6329378.1 hypothetical protein [Nitrospira sp.]
MATQHTHQKSEEGRESRFEFLNFRHESSCMRCGGLMVPDFCTDLLNGSGSLDCSTRRCVQCGDIVDPVIRLNRHLQQSAVVARELKAVGPFSQAQVSA